MKRIFVPALACLTLVTTSVAFGAADEEKVLLKAQASSPAVIAAFKELSGSAGKIVSENGLDLTAAKTAVEGYYRNEFGKEYEKKNGGKKAGFLDKVLGELTPEQIAAQYYYIAQNKNPLGSKHLLDKGDDKSTYSAGHGKIHPALRKVLEDNGLYDIFMVEPDGRNIYTVYKELDFFDSYSTGHNATSGLGKAFQAALKAKKGEVVESPVENYNFSYDVLALFIGTPIYDGDKLLGVMLMQVNP